MKIAADAKQAEIEQTNDHFKSIIAEEKKLYKILLESYNKLAAFMPGEVFDFEKLKMSF